MKALAWDSITTAHGNPLMCPPEGPHLFIPVFTTREQAVAWAGSDEHVAMMLPNAQAHPLGGAAGDSNEAYGGPGVTCAGGSKPAPTDRLADGMTGPAAAMLHQSPTELGAAPLFASGSRGGGNSAN